MLFNNILTKNFSLFRYDISLMAVLVAIVIILALQIYPTHNSTVYNYDDTVYMNVANNLLQGNGLNISLVFPVTNYWGASLFHLSYDTNLILKQFPSLYSAYDIAPLYFLIFAGYLVITKANPVNWVMIGSIFNIVIFNIFICLYFLWVKKHFGRIISFVSSVIIVCTPTFLIHLTLVEMHPLTWLFMLITFYFIKNTRRDYILFGIFSAFAVLSDQVGIIVILAYSTFLIVKKELVGLSYVLGTWFFLVLPWMIYSHIHYNDLGAGLGIPFSSSISSIINSFLFHQQKIPSQNFLEAIHLTPLTLPFGVFSQILSFETNVSFMIIFILFFSCIAFVSLTTIKKITKRTVMLYGTLACSISTSIMFYYSVSVQYVTNIWNYVVQGLILFGIPILIAILFWLKRDIFVEKKIPRLYLIILFVALHTLLAIYYLGITYVGFDEKYIWPLFFLMLPLGIYGISKILYLFPNRVFSNSKILILVVPLILAPFFLIMYDTTFLQLKNNVSVAYPKDISNYILQHFDRNTVIATPYPGPFFLGTGNPAVAMQDFEPFNFSSYKKFVTTYGVEYFVLQRHKDESSVLRMSLINKKYDIGPNPYFPVVFTSQESNYTIFSRMSCENSVNNIITKNKFEYGLCLEKVGIAGHDVGYHDKAVKAFNSYTPVVEDSIRNLNLLLYLDWQYNDNYAIGNIAEKQNFTNETGIPLELVQKILNLIKNNVTKQFEVAQNLESKQKYPQAIDAYQQILQIDPYNKKATDAVFRLYSNNGTRDLLPQYQQFESQMNQISDFKITHKDTFNIQNIDNERINLLKNEIKVWQHFKDDDQLLVLYQNWYEIDQFSMEANEVYADLSLKLHQDKGITIGLYEHLLQLVSGEKQKEIQVLIDSLKK